MMAHEAFDGHGFESFTDSGLEARGRRASVQLLLVAAIDERQDFPLWAYEQNLDDLRAAKAEALGRGVSLRVGILDYMVFEGSGMVDTLLPIGEPWPDDDIQLLAQDLPRHLDAPPYLIGETPQQYAAWMEELQVGRFLPTSRIVFLLDSSGSMTASEFGDVPHQAAAILKSKTPHLETAVIIDGDESWPRWGADVWNTWKDEHPEE